MCQTTRQAQECMQSATPMSGRACACGNAHVVGSKSGHDVANGYAHERILGRPKQIQQPRVENAHTLGQHACPAFAKGWQVSPRASIVLNYVIGSLTDISVAGTCKRCYLLCNSYRRSASVECCLAAQATCFIHAIWTTSNPCKPSSALQASRCCQDAGASMGCGGDSLERGCGRARGAGAVHEFRDGEQLPHRLRWQLDAVGGQSAMQDTDGRQALRRHMSLDGYWWELHHKGKVPVHHSLTCS